VVTHRNRQLRAPILLIGGFALFLVAIVVLVGSSLVRRDVPTFSPSPFGRARPTLRLGEADTLTVDATASDRWQRVALERRAIVDASDSAGWDLAVRRHHVIAGDAIADLGPASFDGVSRAPAGGYVANRVGADTTNEAIERWYSYSLWSHLLTPRGHVYVVRTPLGRYAKLEVLSYYCPGLHAGCMTFRYAFLPPDRS
jgi:heme-binding HmuY-like protein